MKPIKIEGFDKETTAKMLNVSMRTIERYLASGKIKGEKIAGRWFFPKEEIMRLKELKKKKK